MREEWLSLARLEDAFGGPGQMVSYAAQLDDGASLRWPFDLETGAVDPEAWARWERSFPLTMLEDPETVALARASLDRRLFISVGRADAIGLFAPAERFHERLEELGIGHEWRPTDEGHFEGALRRLAEGLDHLAVLLTDTRAPRISASSWNSFFAPAGKRARK